jgi:hypothetical protein
VTDDELDQQVAAAASVSDLTVAGLPLADHAHALLEEIMYTSNAGQAAPDANDPAEPLSPAVSGASHPPAEPDPSAASGDSAGPPFTVAGVDRNQRNAAGRRRQRRWGVAVLAAAAVVVAVVAGTQAQGGRHTRVAANDPGIGTAPTASSTSSAVTSTTLTQPAVLPDGSPPPPGQHACAASELNLYNTFGTLTPERSIGLFVMIARTGLEPCWLDGHPGISLRTPEGIWTTFALHPSNLVVTNGPHWTGVFDPSLTGVVVFGSSVPSGTSQRYTALRLVLPNQGGTLEDDRIDLTLTSADLTAHAFEADSRDQ